MTLHYARDLERQEGDAAKSPTPNQPARALQIASPAHRCLSPGVVRARACVRPSSERASDRTVNLVSQMPIATSLHFCNGSGGVSAERNCFVIHTKLHAVPLSFLAPFQARTKRIAPCGPFARPTYCRRYEMSALGSVDEDSFLSYVDTLSTRPLPCEQDI